MIYLILILKGFLLSWLILKFEPIQIYVIGFLEGLNEGLFKKIPFIYFILGTIFKVPTCGKCLGFWMGLILSGSIWVAIVTSILHYHYDKWDSSKGVKLW